MPPQPMSAPSAPSARRPTAIVRPAGAGLSHGVLEAGDHRFPCALGRGGVRLDKREGDGATPVGDWPFRLILYRSDRVSLPASGLAQDPIRPDDGWCDAPSSPMYNQAVRHPYAASAEHLWRADHLYDIIVVLGHNDAPVVPGHGSAIFLHVARADLSPTEGCIALNLNDLLAFLTLVPGLWGVTVAGA